MDPQEAHKLLLNLDSTYSWDDEFPSNFEYEEEVREVRRVNKLLENELGLTLNVCTAQAQDSYFFAEIVFPSREPFASDLLLDIRFSSFGRLVSASARPGIPARKADVLGTVRKILEREGYKYIDFDWLLQNEYDGSHRLEWDKSITWWDRFLSYNQAAFVLSDSETTNYLPVGRRQLAAVENERCQRGPLSLRPGGLPELNDRPKICSGQNHHGEITMQTAQQSGGRWVSCDSRSALVAQLPLNACKLVATDSPSSWGYMALDSNIVVPIGHADMGLPPVAVKHGDRIFVGINELLVGYDRSSRCCLFKYKMPTVFHEFVRFDQNEMIVRDEIGFIGLSYDGVENWNFCIDVIANYKIDQATIFGETEEGKIFEFTIPYGENLTQLPLADGR